MKLLSIKSYNFGVKSFVFYFWFSDSAFSHIICLSGRL